MISEGPSNGSTQNPSITKVRIRWFENLCEALSMPPDGEGNLITQLSQQYIHFPRLWESNPERNSVGEKASSRHDNKI